MATHIQSQNDNNTKIKTLGHKATKKINRHNNDIFSSSKLASLVSVCVFSFFIPYVIANSELNLHSTSTTSSLDVINTNRTVHSLKIKDGHQGESVDGFPSQPTGCRHCMREGLRNISLQSIKEQILSKLGMKHAPNTTGRTWPNKESVHQILTLFARSDPGHGGATHGMQGDDPSASPVFKPGPVVLDEEDDYHARTERVIAFAQPHPKLRHGWRPSQDVQYFRFSDKVARNKVLSAQLWVYVRGTDYEFPSSSSSASTSSSEGNDGSVVTPFNILVLKVLRTGEAKSDSPPYAQVLSEKRHRPRGKGGWISLAIKGLMIEWFKSPRNNLGIIIQGTDSQGRQLVVTDHDQENRTLIPFVEVNTTDGRKHRTKRTIGLNCDESSEESRCCRYPLTVDFEEFGWDWIIAPKRYEANYCSGDCPYVFLQKYPHTHIVHLANPNGSAGPCCAPRKMSAISMLYFDNEFNIIYGMLPGMVVDRCGCS